MSLLTGRQGLIGLGIEATPGTAVPATTAIPFVANTLKSKQEALKDIAARGSRAQNFTSVLGKRWSEGEITVNADTLSLGYFLKLATGTEIVNTVTAGVYQHLFYTTVSGNTPLTATIYQYQGVDTQAFPSMVVDKLDLEVKDNLMTAKTAFKGFPHTNGAFTNQTVSGTLLAFNNYQLQLGNTLVAAAAAPAAPVTEFLMSIENHAETVFESGQPNTTRVFWKELTVKGSFTRFFESTVDRDNYLSATKQSVILTASGINLGGGNREQLVINLAKLLYTDSEITTGLENFFAIKTTFEAEVDVVQGKQYDITLTNYRSTAYS